MALPAMADRYGVQEAMDESSGSWDWVIWPISIAVLAWGWHDSVKQRDATIRQDRERIQELKTLNSRLREEAADAEQLRAVNAALTNALDDYYDGLIDEDEMSDAAEKALSRPPGRPQNWPTVAK